MQAVQSFPSSRVIEQLSLLKVLPCLHQFIEHCGFRTYPSHHRNLSQKLPVRRLMQNIGGDSEGIQSLSERFHPFPVPSRNHRSQDFEHEIDHGSFQIFSLTKSGIFHMNTGRQLEGRILPLPTQLVGGQVTVVPRIQPPRLMMTRSFTRTR